MHHSAVNYMATFIVLAVFSFVPTASLYAAEAIIKTPAAAYAVPVQPQKAVQRPAKEQALSQITQAASKAGINTCLPRINQITNFVTGNAPNGAMLFAAPANPDKKQFSVSMEVSSQTSSVPSYVTTSFSPAADGSCSGSYEVVTYWLSSCPEIAKTVYSEFAPAQKPLQQQITVLGEGPSVRVFLLPVARGCVSIKKEIVF